MFLEVFASEPACHSGRSQNVPLPYDAYAQRSRENDLGINSKDSSRFNLPKLKRGQFC
jgi:hypothetical protein